MKILEALKLLVYAIGPISSVWYLLAAFGLIPEPLFQGVIFMHEYILIPVIVAIGVFFFSTLWLGSHLHTRSGKGTSEQLHAADERFRGLVFHFSRKTDTPQTFHDPPNFVVNKKEAYPIPQYLEPYLKTLQTNFHSHDGIDKLNEHFKTNGINPNPEEPSYKDLGLVMGWDGFLHLPDLDWNHLLEKLNGRKIKPDRATIVRLYPCHRAFRSKPFFTNNRLLILHCKSPKEAWWTPFHDYDLIHNRFIDSSEGTKLHLSFWCWLHHYRYMPYHFDEDRLLELLGE